MCNFVILLLVSFFVDLCMVNIVFVLIVFLFDSEEVFGVFILFILVDDFDLNFIDVGWLKVYIGYGLFGNLFLNEKFGIIWLKYFV